MKVEKVQRKCLADSSAAFLRRRPSRWLIPRQGCSISLAAGLAPNDPGGLFLLQRRLQVGGLDFGANAGIAGLHRLDFDRERGCLSGPELVEPGEGDLAG